MARGDGKLASAYTFNLGTKKYDAAADGYAYYFVTDAFAAINANAPSLALADFTLVASSGNYTQGTALSGVTYTQTTDKSELKASNFSFLADAANPTTARCMIIVNTTSPLSDVVSIVDLTTNGTTQADMTQGFEYSFPSGVVYSIQVNAV